jgi:hypothetical protein
MGVAAIVAALLVGGSGGHLITMWYVHRHYNLWPKDRTVRRDIL